MAFWIDPRPKRRWRRAITSNALTTGVICVLISGTISFFVSRQQSQDAARQAIITQHATQQASAALQLEADAKRFGEEADQLLDARILTRSECAAKGTLTPSCTQFRETPAQARDLNKLELDFSTDLANISDQTVTQDAGNLEEFAMEAIDDVGTPQAIPAQHEMNFTYEDLLARLGQLVQGR